MSGTIGARAIARAIESVADGSILSVSASVAVSQKEERIAEIAE
jgi:hypothetical protein